MGIRSFILRRKGPKEFSSWTATCAAAGNTYEYEMLTRFRVERSAQRIADGQMLRGNIINLVARLIGKPNMSITDFGGATGDLGEDFLLEFPAATYTVVETTQLVEMMSRLERRVTFATDIPAACDIFLTSGTLQYLADPLGSLRSGLNTARFAAVLVRNCFSEIERYTVQRSRLFENGVGPLPGGWRDVEIDYPHRSLKEADILSIAQECGFSCLVRLEESSGALAGNYGKQMVFWRDQSIIS